MVALIGLGYSHDSDCVFVAAAAIVDWPVATLLGKNIVALWQQKGCCTFVGFVTFFPHICIGLALVGVLNYTHVL